MKKLILLMFFSLITYSFSYKIEENFTGKIVKKYGNGQLQSLENFKNGKLNGELKEFYKDGTLFQIGSFKDGEMENIKVFDENGNLKFEVTFEDRIGYHKGYHPNGTLSEEGKTYKGDEIGIWKYYDEKGKLINEKLFVEKVKHKNKVPIILK